MRIRIKRIPQQHKQNSRHWKHGLGGNLFGMGGGNPFTVGATIDSLYASNPKEEFLGEPDHHYDFTQSEEWADAHGYYPDARGHRDDRVKKLAHPSHPSRGTWNGDTFMLSDLGMQNPNYTLFGLNDGGQDPQATLTYNGGVVLPEITVTPKENYIFNPYDNIILHQKALGGNLFEIGGPKYEFDSTMYTHPEDTAGLLAEQVVTPNGNYPVLNPKGGEAWTIEALNDLGVPLYTKTSIPKQKDVELQHLEDKAKADEFVSKTIGNGEAFTPWGLSGLSINEGVGAAASALPESAQEVLAKGRYISPSYWVDRGTGLSDEQLISGEGKLFGTGTGTMFDILSTKGIGKGADVAATEAANAFSKIRQLNRLEKNYTGVPHKELKEAPGTYMDEVFPNNHIKHTVWSTDDIDYPRSFDGPDRTVYDIYTDPKELSILETPSIPEDKMLYWQGLPYKLENGKVSFADNLSSEQAWIPRSKDISLKKGGIGGNYTPDEVASYIMKDGENGLKILDWKKAPGTISTDDVVKYSLNNGYDATRFNRVFDGASEIDGTLYDYPINELVLNPNTPRYVLPHGASKLRLWNQLPTKYSQSNYFATSLPYTTLFRNYTNNE